MRIELVCWHCGISKAAEVPHEPRFAFEVAGWANDVGMYGVMDTADRRSLVFCNQSHAQAEQTKAGGFRVRAKGPAKAQAEAAALPA